MMSHLHVRRGLPVMRVHIVVLVAVLLCCAYAQDQRISDVSGLVEALRSDHASSRIYAARALGELGAEASPACEELGRAVRSDDGHLRLVAAEALAKIGPDAVPTLIAILDDPAELAQQAAIRALGLIGPDAEQAIPLLDERFCSATAALTSHAALRSLIQMGRKSVPVLVPHLKDPNHPRTRASSALALGEIACSASTVVPALVPVLTDADVETRANAATALGSFGAEASSAVKALCAALRTEDDRTVRGRIGIALGRIGGDGTEFLMRTVESKDANLKNILELE